MDPRGLAIKSIRFQEYKETSVNDFPRQIKNTGNFNCPSQPHVNAGGFLYSLSKINQGA
jgi:hypothetical protein